MNYLRAHVAPTSLMVVCVISDFHMSLSTSRFSRFGKTAEGEVGSLLTANVYVHIIRPLCHIYYWTCIQPAHLGHVQAQLSRIRSSTQFSSLKAQPIQRTKLFLFPHHIIASTSFVLTTSQNSPLNPSTAHLCICSSSPPPHHTAVASLTT